MFDTVLIGSGPPALMHGLSLARRGERVAFIDRSAALGGAWRPTPAFGLGPIEVGVHLLENRRHVNDYIRALIGADRVTLSSRDFGMLRHRRVPMRYFRIMLYALVFIKSACHCNMEKSKYSFSRLMYGLQGITTPFVYPSAGFGSVLDILEKRLRDDGARFIFNEDIRHITVKNSEVVILTDQNVYSAGRVVMSSRANAPVQGSETEWHSQRTVTIPNLLLRMRDAEPTFDGYVEFLGTGFLKRVRNVGALRIGRDIGSDTIIAAQLRNVPKGMEPIEFVEASKSQLIRSNLVSASARVVDHALYLHTYNEMPIAALDRVRRRFPAQIYILRTKDLSDEIHSVQTLRDNRVDALAAARAKTPD